MQLKVAMNLRMTQVSAKSVAPFMLMIVKKERRNGLVVTIVLDGIITIVWD